MDLGKLVDIDKNWIGRELTHHYTESINDKLKVRLYTIKASGTIISANSLAETLLDLLPDYFKTKAQIKEDIKREVDKHLTEDTTGTEIDIYERSIGVVRSRSYRQAAKFFKKKSANTKSGKYGELLLFACAEALYDCKMVAHKITNLTNYHDEIKGGDGIFLGKYILRNSTTRDAYFIGESKVWKDYSSAQNDALDSINRFYHDDVQANFNSLEFFIARKDIEKFNDGTNNIDELYDRLSPTSKIYKDQIAVHPILIMFDTPSYSKLMVKASDNKELEQLIANSVKDKVEKTLEDIKNKVEKYNNLKKVYLDFILIPTESIDTFNKTMDDLI